MVTVKMKHLREIEYCSRGARAFFARHNLDFSDFLKNGISEEKLIKTNDAMALKAIEQARLDDGR